MYARIPPDELAEAIAKSEVRDRELHKTEPRAREIALAEWKRRGWPLDEYRVRALKGRDRFYSTDGRVVIEVALDTFDVVRAEYLEGDDKDGA